jgi:glycosyltransferase involved in cell wall biosynthesis
MRPLVSITVISFNQAPYLVECLDSAVGQTYEALEVLVRDDCSTDESRDILADYAARYPDRIKPLYAPKNGGLAENRHQVQMATRGDYLAWLDADDVAEPTRIERQVEFLQSNPAASLCYFNMRIARNGTLTPDLVYGPHRRPLTGDHVTLLKNENFIMSSALMYDVAKVGNRGYHFAQGPTFSDWHFFVRLASKGQIGYLDDVLGTYRRHGDAATATSSATSSGVRRRREAALQAMRQEFSGQRALLDYCLARFYLSQMAAARRERNNNELLRSARMLLRRPGPAVRAAQDRWRGSGLLPSFE